MSEPIRNCRIGYHNWCWEPGTTFGASIGPALNAAQIAALRSRQISRQAQFVADLSPNFTALSASFSEPREVDIVALLNIRPTNLALVNAEVFFQGTWGDETVSAFARPVDGLMTPNLIGIPTEPRLCDNVEVWLTWARIDPLLPFSFRASQLWAGPTWSPEQGISEGWSLRAIDSGEMQVAQSGAGFGRQRRVLREFSGSMAITSMPGTVGEPSGWFTTKSAQWLMHRVGISSPVLFCPFTRTGDARGATAMYGHFSDLGLVESRGGGHFEWNGWRVRELQ